MVQRPDRPRSPGTTAQTAGYLAFLAIVRDRRRGVAVLADISRSPGAAEDRNGAAGAVSERVSRSPTVRATSSDAKVTTFGRRQARASPESATCLRAVVETAIPPAPVSSATSIAPSGRSGTTGRHRQQLAATGELQRVEVQIRGLDGLTDDHHAVAAQHQHVLVAERRRDPLALTVGAADQVVAVVVGDPAGEADRHLRGGHELWLVEQRQRGRVRRVDVQHAAGVGAPLVQRAVDSVADLEQPAP